MDMANLLQADWSAYFSLVGRPSSLKIFPPSSTIFLVTGKYFDIPQQSQILNKGWIFFTYVNALHRQVDVVEQFVVILDAEARGKENHDLLLPVLLQKSEQE